MTSFLVNHTHCICGTESGVDTCEVSLSGGHTEPAHPEPRRRLDHSHAPQMNSQLVSLITGGQR